MNTIHCNRPLGLIISQVMPGIEFPAGAFVNLFESPDASCWRRCRSGDAKAFPFGTFSS